MPVGRKRGRVEPCGVEVVPIENPGEQGVLSAPGDAAGVPLDRQEAGADRAHGAGGAAGSWAARREAECPSVRLLQ